MMALLVMVDPQECLERKAKEASKVLLARQAQKANKASAASGV